MAVSVSVLASGSRGNCALVATSSTRILVDAGLSGRETFKRLRALGERAEEISAILITHEHSDHVAGLQRLATKLNVPVFLTAPTHHAWSRAVRDSSERARSPNCRSRSISPPAAAFAWAISRSCPSPSRTTPPTRWASPFARKASRSVLPPTWATCRRACANHLRGCTVLVMESNHDVEMLRSGPYPWSVKQRVMSRVGHLLE